LLQTHVPTTKASFFLLFERNKQKKLKQGGDKTDKLYSAKFRGPKSNHEIAEITNFYVRKLKVIIE
jgi:hypothetical protein